MERQEAYIVPSAVSQPLLRIVPVSLDLANDWVRRLHRHHKPVTGHKFSIGAVSGGVLCGVAIVGRPVARLLDDGTTLEVLRCCTDGTRNACSALYGACKRVARGMGYCRIYTYTLPIEGGSSLRGTGWIDDGPAGGGGWVRPNRPRIDKAPLDVKTRWVAQLNPAIVWSDALSALETGQMALLESLES